jgi:hypothetical protein
MSKITITLSRDEDADDLVRVTTEVSEDTVPGSPEARLAAALLLFAGSIAESYTVEVPAE